MGKTPKVTKDKVNTTIWLMKTQMERAENLVEWLESDPMLIGGGRINRSTVIRLAVEKGLELLEFEASKAKK